MPYFMIQVSYTPEAWAAMLKNPHDRGEAVRGVIEALGGRMEQFWYAFGEYDVVAIAQMPNNVGAAAFALAAVAGGACKAYKTTPLLTPEEAIDSMKKAAASKYKPPSVKARKAGP